ncbi:MAG: hypothetical protein RR945_04915 [Erysipelotrichaceae bacterium]
MASIAYVTDQNMIEFHRLNGNKKMNFWRPSASKKMVDFNNGDFLFFLAKGTQRGRKKEKGIIGYGKFTKVSMLSFNQMWKRYETLNGYATKEYLYEAIVKVTKDKQMPKQLSCLELEDIVFFQAPIYLSELGMKISNSIESYIYLDREDMLITNKILAKAQTIGVDAWTQMFESKANNTFTNDALWSAISNISEKINQFPYTAYEYKRINRFANQLVGDNEMRAFLANNRSDFLEWNNGTITINIPCIVNVSDYKTKLQYLIGHYMSYVAYISQMQENDKKAISLCIVFNQEIDDYSKTMIENLKINYEIIGE